MLLKDHQPPTDYTNILGWTPLRSDRRIAIMIHPPGGRSLDALQRDLSVLRDSAWAIQTGLRDVLNPGQKLYSRLFWFLDNQCHHSSNWSPDIADIADQTRQAHCYQGNSRYEQAFESLVADQTKLVAQSPLDFIDGVILIGGRVDDRVEAVLSHIRALAERGTKVFAFNTDPNNTRTVSAFADLAKAGNGASVGVQSIQDTRAHIPALAQAIMRPEKARLLLENQGEVGRGLLIGFQAPK